MSEHEAKLSFGPEYELINNPEFGATLRINLLGRIEFGTGNIDAIESAPEEFRSQLRHVASQGLIYVPDIKQLQGGCMDGRGNIKTIDGNPVAPRPKVIGGPSLLAWNLASIGNYEIIKGISDPLDQFVIVNNALLTAGFRLGMHVQCGAAMGASAVTEKYGINFSEINEHIGSEAKGLLDEDSGLADELMQGLEMTASSLGRSNNFTEEKMHEVVSDMDGRDSIIILDSKHDHPTHNHNEIALIQVRVNNAVVFKDNVIGKTGIQVFYQNNIYARRLNMALARTPRERAKGLIICDQLPIAGVATLGKNQHVGEIVGAIND